MFYTCRHIFLSIRTYRCSPSEILKVEISQTCLLFREWDSRLYSTIHHEMRTPGNLGISEKFKMNCSQTKFQRACLL